MGHAPPTHGPRPTCVASNLASEELLRRITSRGELSALPHGCTAAGGGGGGGWDGWSLCHSVPIWHARADPQRARRCDLKTQSRMRRWLAPPCPRPLPPCAAQPKQRRTCEGDRLVLCPVALCEAERGGRQAGAVRVCGRRARRRGGGGRRRGRRSCRPGGMRCGAATPECTERRGRRRAFKEGPGPSRAGAERQG